MTAGAGFLLAVLWFDLMFDVQVRRHAERELPAVVVGSIATYYARVTTGARPMNRLVAAAMLATVVAIAVQIARGDDARWAAWVSLVLTLTAVGLAGASPVPNAVRLGERDDPPDVQAQLARAIFRDHLVCFALVTAVLAIQLAAV